MLPIGLAASGALCAGEFQAVVEQEGDSSEMEDEESIMLPLDLQLILMSHLPPGAERDERFIESCSDGE